MTMSGPSSRADSPLPVKKRLRSVGTNTRRAWLNEPDILKAARRRGRKGKRLELKIKVGKEKKRCEDEGDGGEEGKDSKPVGEEEALTVTKIKTNSSVAVDRPSKTEIVKTGKKPAAAMFAVSPAFSPIHGTEQYRDGAFQCNYNGCGAEVKIASWPERRFYLRAHIEAVHLDDVQAAEIRCPVEGCDKNRYQPLRKFCSLKKHVIMASSLFSTTSLGLINRLLYCSTTTVLPA